MDTDDYMTSSLYRMNGHIFDYENVELHQDDTRSIAERGQALKFKRKHVTLCESDR